jgi:DNA replication protein DnaC
MSDQSTNGTRRGDPRPIGADEVTAALPGEARERVRRAAPGEPPPPYEGRETERERIEREEMQRAHATAARARRLDDWARRVPARFAGARLDGLWPNQDPDGAVSGFLGSGAATLLLVGGTGAGKSHTAYAVGQAAVDGGGWATGGTVGDLVDALREDQGSGGGQVYADLVAADVVILDELGMERGTEFSLEMVQRVIDARWRDARTLVVTTNLTAEQIEIRYGSRVLDRLRDGALIVKLTGDSARRERLMAW